MSIRMSINVTVVRIEVTASHVGCNGPSVSAATQEMLNITSILFFFAFF